MSCGATLYLSLHTASPLLRPLIVSCTLQSSFPSMIIHGRAQCHHGMRMYSILM